MTCLLKDRKTSALLWTGVDERKYPENISEILMVKFKWCCHLATLRSIAVYKKIDAVLDVRKGFL